MNKVRIKVTSRQNSLDGEKDCIDLLTIGKHYYKNNMHYILYDENIGGEAAANVQTMLKINAASLTLVRRGAVEQELFFALKTSSDSVYKTAYGNLLLTVYPKKIMIDYGAIAGTIAIEYDLAINGVLQSYNSLQINISAEIGEEF